MKSINYHTTYLNKKKCGPTFKYKKNIHFKLPKNLNLFHLFHNYYI